MSTKISKTEEEWRAELTPEQYDVLRRKGTERPFTGKYVHTKADGTYTCAACGAELFSSKTKFESGTGWPSFWEPANTENVELRSDNSFFMRRTEVLCRKCGSHLGHVFDDGPQPTGQRFCINSAALDLKPSEPARSPEVVRFTKRRSDSSERFIAIRTPIRVHLTGKAGRLEG